MGENSKMSSEKIIIALPAYNEEKVISDVISAIKKLNLGNCVVINDGSTDKTAIFAKKEGAFVISHFKNSGLGVAIKTALKYAKKENADILITLDSDGQHNPFDVPKFIKEIHRRYDVVCGVRNLKNKNVPHLRKFILFLSNIYTFLLFGIYSHDSQSGFRAFSKRAISLMNLRGEKMEISSEIFSEIKRCRLKYKEVSIDTIYTDYSKSKGQKNSNMFDVAWKLLISLFK